MELTHSTEMQAEPSVQPYEAPKVVEYGDLMTMTAATVWGNQADANFPTPCRGGFHFS